MKRNSIMEESRKLITPEIKQAVDLAIRTEKCMFTPLNKKGKRANQ